MHHLHRHEADTLILHELGLRQGSARVDLAVVNGSLHGYEIKSEADTLERLPGQRSIYASSLDFVTIVMSEKHSAKVRRSVPRWWGMWVVTRTNGDVALAPVRAATPNPHLEALAVAELLWRDEVIEELELRGLARGYRSKPRPLLWRHLAESVSLFELRSVVRSRLKQRGDRWREAALRPVSSGDWCPLSSKSSHFQAPSHDGRSEQ